jgi:hypothetical protein
MVVQVQSISGGKIKRVSSLEGFAIEKLNVIISPSFTFLCLLIFGTGEMVFTSCEKEKPAENISQLTSKYE